eukprot:gene6243-7774_t
MELPIDKNDMLSTSPPDEFKELKKEDSSMNYISSNDEIALPQSSSSISTTSSSSSSILNKKLSILNTSGGNSNNNSNNENINNNHSDINSCSEESDDEHTTSDKSSSPLLDGSNNSINNNNHSLKEYNKRMEKLNNGQDLDVVDQQQLLQHLQQHEEEKVNPNYDLDEEDEDEYEDEDDGDHDLENDKDNNKQEKELKKKMKKLNLKSSGGKKKSKKQNKKSSPQITTSTTTTSTTSKNPKSLLLDKVLEANNSNTINERGLFSPTEFVKSTPVSNNKTGHTGVVPPPQPLNLSAGMLGFNSLGMSHLLSNQNPHQTFPSNHHQPTTKQPTNPLMCSVAPPVSHILPDESFCTLQQVLDQDGNYIVPSSKFPILDIDDLFADIILPSNQENDNNTNNNNNVQVGSSTTTSEIPLDLKVLQLSGSRVYYNRELTELIYFYRILYEGYNSSLPILERIRFLAITSQNIDMYFCKRALKLRLGYISTRKTLKPEERYINMVLNTTRNLINDKYHLFVNILLPELAQNNIFILKYSDLLEIEKEQLRSFFLQHVFPIMTPLVVDAGHPFPNLSNLSLNIAVLLKHDEEHTRFVRIKVPSRIPRFVHIKHRSPYCIIPMEEIILANLDTLFPNTEILTKSLFRVTRHNDLKLNEDDANDLLELIKTELHKRRFAPMVRLEVSTMMPTDIIDMLKSQLHLDDSEVYIINGPLGLADLFELCKLNLPHLKFEPWTPHIPTPLVNLAKFPNEDIFSVIKRGEMLINLPYLSFNSSVQFFIESAVKDQKVLAIKIAIYRTSSNSPLIRALCEAATHKEVSVLVDLKASGDEEQNTKYARLLEQAGCHVSYGLVGLKTHAKIAMVVREEENGLREYLHMSTGNYNASTADIYADMGLFSCDKELGADMCDLFNYLTGYSKITSFRKLLIAPMNMRSTLIQLIETEAKNAREGKEASIYAVMNGLDEKRIANSLYQASIAGVKITLVVRGRCRILPGIPGISDNIKVISILGRFLEHSRIYCFSNNGNPKAYIASADWLHRNLKRRVEVLVPVEDPNNIKQLYDIIDVYCNDPNSWEMLPDGRYKKIANSTKEDSQNTFMKRTIQQHPVIWSK